MTTIRFYYKNNNITGFECCGHSGYAEEGSDIVCASISALTGACHLGLKQVLNLEVKSDINRKTGFFSLKINKETDEKAQVLLKTLYLALVEIQSDYSDYLKIENRRGT